MTEYQSIPFWSWNDKLKPDELRRQIRWMKHNGMGGFFMHARGGLKTEYMSEEWMQCIDVCIDEAEKNGMAAWIYDENGWPSGFAGGKLLVDENNRDCYLTYAIGIYDKNAYVSYSMEGNKLIRITQNTNDEQCLNIYLHISVSTVDILNSNVVRLFIEETHERYRERYGEEFSKKIKGFFTDEPQFYRESTAYSKMLEAYFKQNYHEDVLDGLGLLFCEKEGYRKFRYKYWLAMHKLMLHSFGKQVYDWCENNGVRFTGHYVEENSLGLQMNCCAGIMPFYKYMHMPGIDWLGRKHENRLALRQLASVAAQYGKKHTLTETFGCCGWDITPKELKAIAEFQYIGGLNLMCHHLVPYSERGQRKRDYPAHYSEVNPWVREYFKEFNDYFTNVGCLLSNSTEVVNVAVLHPIRSAYFNYKRFERGFNIIELEDKFKAQVKMLSDANVMFHFLDETLLAEDGFVQDGKIGCGLCMYDYLILPTIYTMDKSTEALLAEYVKNSGKILLLDEKPRFLEGEEYTYDYLESNVTFEEMYFSQPYAVKDVSLPIHSAFRRLGEKRFIYVQNYSYHDAHTTEFVLKDGYKSLNKVDLQTGCSEIVSTRIRLEPGEAQILFLSKKEVKEVCSKESVSLNPSYDVLENSGNYLVLDNARYSKDNLHYSNLFSHMGIFQKMLEERYRGPLYLKTTFQVQEIPKEMWLLAETENILWVQVNGAKVIFSERSDFEQNILKADIADKVCQGKNEILVYMNFYQSEAVYYALFGENVTETLKNCLVYDTNIEAMYLQGDFGVYEQYGLQSGVKPNVLIGEKFYIGKKQSHIHHLAKDGYPFFAGKIKLRQTLYLDKKEKMLVFRGKIQAAKVFVNGQYAGKFLMNNKIDITPYATTGENEIILELIVGNRNLLGPHHYKPDEAPEVVLVDTFELPNSWKDCVSDKYRESYSILETDLF